MTNDAMQAAIDRYSAAAQGTTADLHDATGALLEAFAAQCQQLTTQVCLLLVQRIEALEQRNTDIQQHLEAIDRQLYNLQQMFGRERSIGA